MFAGGRLYHSYRGGKLKGPATSADYANMISAALALYQVTNEKRYLDDAVAWTAIMNRHYDAESGGYYLVADDTSDLILRPLSASDDAVPNPNATMLQNLADLYTFTGDAAYLEAGGRTFGRLPGGGPDDGAGLYRPFVWRAHADFAPAYRPRGGSGGAGCRRLAQGTL